MSSPNNAYKSHRGLTTTGATEATGILAAAVGLHRGGGVQLSGTFVGTVQFEETLDGGTTWIAKTVYPAGGGTGVTSATATGQWKFACGGSTNFRARCSAFTSGTIGVDLTLTEGVDPIAASGGTMPVATGPRATYTATIASGASLSGAVDIGNATLAAILMPAAWTAAGLAFQGSFDGITYAPVWNDSGNVYAVPSASAVASQLVALYLPNFLGLRYIKVQSATSGSPVVQAADRVLTLCAAP